MSICAKRNIHGIPRVAGGRREPITADESARARGPEAAWLAPLAAAAFRPEAPLTERQRAAMAFLEQHPRARVAHIARGLDCAHQTAGSIVEALRVRGRVVRDGDFVSLSNP